MKLPLQESHQKPTQNLQHRNEPFLPCSLVSCTGYYMKWMNHGWEGHWFNSLHVHFTLGFQYASLNTCTEHSRIISAFLKDRAGMVFPISIKVLHAELFRIINILEKYKISTQYLSIYNWMKLLYWELHKESAPKLHIQCCGPWFRAREWWWTLRGKDWFLGRSFLRVASRPLRSWAPSMQWICNSRIQSVALATSYGQDWIFSQNNISHY